MKKIFKILLIMLITKNICAASSYTISTTRVKQWQETLIVESMSKILKIFGFNYDNNQNAFSQINQFLQNNWHSISNNASNIGTYNYTEDKMSERVACLETQKIFTIATKQPKYCVVFGTQVQTMLKSILHLVDLCKKGITMPDHYIFITSNRQLSLKEKEFLKNTYNDSTSQTESEATNLLIARHLHNAISDISVTINYSIDINDSEKNI